MLLLWNICKTKPKKFNINNKSERKLLTIGSYSSIQPKSRTNIETFAVNVMNVA